MIATDPLSLVFITCFLVGFGFFLITALLGGLTHGHSVGHAGAHHGNLHIGHTATHATSHGPVHAHTHASGQSAGQGRGSPNVANQATQNWAASLFAVVNPTTVGVFLLGFGFFGYLFHNTTHLVAALSLALGGGSGLILAALLLVLLSRIFASSEGSTIQDVSDRTGLLGKVSITIQENNIGQIIYVSPGGMRKSIPARSIDGRRIERDQEVVVVNYTKGVAEVDTWEHFVNEAEEGLLHEPASIDELAQLRALLNESSMAETEYVMRKDVQKE